MLYINKITNDASQRLMLTGINGIQINMTLRFMPRQSQWIMGVSYGDFSAQGIAVVCGLNLLQKFKNIIPFGISCVCTNGLDPYTLNAFVDQQANLYLLNAEDVETIQAEWFE